MRFRVNTIMRLSHATPAIVLRSRPFGESDKIVSLLTKDFGKISGIAKGAMRSRKRFVNSLEPFALVNLRFQDRPHSNLVFILTADLTIGYRQLVNSLESISHAAYLIEITEGLIAEREQNQAVYQHLSQGLSYLEKYGTSLRFLTWFELKLLRLVGYQPALDRCRRCAKVSLHEAVLPWFFSLVDGGILCDTCAISRRETLPLGAKAVEILAALQSESNDLSASFLVSLSIVNQIRAVMLRFIQFHMAREIKSAVFLGSQHLKST